VSNTESAFEYKKQYFDQEAVDDLSDRDVMIMDGRRSTALRAFRINKGLSIATGCCLLVSLTAPFAMRNHPFSYFMIAVSSIAFGASLRMAIKNQKDAKALDVLHHIKTGMEPVYDDTRTRAQATGLRIGSENGKLLTSKVDNTIDLKQDPDGKWKPFF
jgi:hypothetical protein